MLYVYFCVNYTSTTRIYTYGPTLSRHVALPIFESIARRGKYLIVTLDSDDRMIWHLGMSGRLFVLDAAHPLVKHDHVDFVLASGKLVRFPDPRRFGAVLWWPADEAAHPLLATMGPYPFAPAINVSSLSRKSLGRTLAVHIF